MDKDKAVSGATFKYCNNGMKLTGRTLYNISLDYRNTTQLNQTRIS